MAFYSNFSNQSFQKQVSFDENVIDAENKTKIKKLETLNHTFCGAHIEKYRSRIPSPLRLVIYKNIKNLNLDFYSKLDSKNSKEMIFNSSGNINNSSIIESDQIEIERIPNYTNLSKVITKVVSECGTKCFI